MRLLRTERTEAAIGDDGLGLEILELGRVGAGLSGKMNEHLGAFERPVMVGREIGDEIGRIVEAYLVPADIENVAHSFATS